jgi:hypothetical protein
MKADGGIVKKIFESFSEWEKVIYRTTREAMLPSVGAAIWGAVVGIHKASTVDGMSAAGIAFFFVLALQGQILRVAKNVRDEKHATEVSDSFATIRQALEEIRKQNLVESGARAIPGAASKNDQGSLTGDFSLQPQDASLANMTRRKFFDQAHQALHLGLLYPAALVAAIGFEQAIRDLASLERIETRQPLSAIVIELEQRHNLGELSAKLAALLHLRNSLVHAENKAEELSAKEATDIIDAFNTGLLQLYVRLQYLVEKLEIITG